MYGIRPGRRLRHEKKGRRLPKEPFGDLLGGRFSVLLLLGVNDKLRIGNRDAILVEEDLDLAVDVALHLIAHHLVAFGSDAEHDAAVGKRLDADVGRSVDDGLVLFLDLSQVFLQDSFDSLDVVAIADGDVADGRRQLGGHVDQRPDVGVVDDLDVSAGILDLRRPDAHLLHGPAEAVDDDDVADLKGMLEDDEDPGEDVLDQGLGSQSDDEGQDSGAREQDGRVDPKRSQDGEDQDDGAAVLRKAREQVCQRPSPPEPRPDEAQQEPDEVRDRKDDEGQRKKADEHLQDVFGCRRLRRERREGIEDLIPVHVLPIVGADDQEHVGGKDDGDEETVDQQLPSRVLLHGGTSFLGLLCG